jgi:hypothetical protein
MLEGFDRNAFNQPHEKWETAFKVPDEESIVNVGDKLRDFLALEAAVRRTNEGNARTYLVDEIYGEKASCVRKSDPIGQIGLWKHASVIY